ncbi:MAG: transglycosylase SLT domain-containing protein [Rikenellaceae bacterium]
MTLKFTLATLLVATLSLSSASAQRLTRKEREAEQVRHMIDSLVEIEIARRDSIKFASSEPKAEKAAPASYDEIQRYNDSLKFNISIEKIDSLVTSWREWQSQAQFDSLFDKYIKPDGDLDESISTVDTLYARRLYDLASPIGMPYNPIVKGYISRYLNIKHSPMSSVLSRAQYYFPIFEEALIRHDMPVDLRMLPIVESAIIPNAVSHAGAAGLWQFMPATAKSYGLEVNYLVDERLDPVRSTDAACRFLKDLYNLYENWPLAVAAYNCGPGNVNKALARAGIKEGSFWDVYYYLPTETRGYVPALIGATYVYTYHKQHNIEYKAPPVPLATDTVRINKILHLGQVAETLDIPIDILRNLNPQYRRDIIPATTKDYSLCMPQRYITEYIAREEEINSKGKKYLKQYTDPANIDKALKYPMGKVHTVKSGETISGIAVKYRTTTRQIMIWNNLKSANKIKVGQKLKVAN